jgi:hypothetical protein
MADLTPDDFSALLRVCRATYRRPELSDKHVVAIDGPCRGRWMPVGSGVTRFRIPTLDGDGFSVVVYHVRPAPPELDDTLWIATSEPKWWICSGCGRRSPLELRCLSCCR